MNLTIQQRHSNKLHFINTFSFIKEGGYYLWKDELKTFKKMNNKFHGTKEGILLVKNITDKKFVDKYFVISFMTDYIPT
jgi:hypothetical protein